MNTLFVGHKIIRLDAVDSTNSYTNQLLREKKLSEGTIVLTENQLKGRGQRGNEWLSKPGENLTMSLVLRPSFLTIADQYYLTKAVSLAIKELVEGVCGEKAEIKWPNDIFVNGQKIAGILIENALRSNFLQYSVVGIGLNINQVEFPAMLHATSLKKLSGQSIDIAVCLEALCSFVEANYLKLKSDKLSLDERYLKALFQRDEWKMYRYNGNSMRAKIIGVAPNGQLLLVGETGQQLTCNFQEIQFMR